MSLILCLFLIKANRKCQIKENNVFVFVFKSGLCSYVFLFKINLDLNSCDFLFFIFLFS